MTVRLSVATVLWVSLLILLAGCTGGLAHDEIQRDTVITPFEDYWTLEEPESLALPTELAEEIEQARVVLRIVVGEDGRVAEIQLVEAEPARDDLIDWIIGVVGEFRYAPTEDNPERQPMITEYTLEFLPDQNDRARDPG